MYRNHKYRFNININTTLKTFYSLLSTLSLLNFMFTDQLSLNLPSSNGARYGGSCLWSPRLGGGGRGSEIQVRSISLGFIRVCFKRNKTKWYTTKMLTSHVGSTRGCIAASHLPPLPFIMTHLPHVSNGLLPVGGANVLYSVPLNLF